MFRIAGHGVMRSAGGRLRYVQPAKRPPKPALLGRVLIERFEVGGEGDPRIAHGVGNPSAALRIKERLKSICSGKRVGDAAWGRCGQGPFVDQRARDSPLQGMEKRLGAAELCRSRAHHPSRVNRVPQAVVAPEADKIELETCRPVLPRSGVKKSYGQLARSVAACQQEFVQFASSCRGLATRLIAARSC